ncbi:sugar phosphate isomerase/epimerase [Flavobacteriaceae bacterium TP-CH-4]|uniref:Sugar phosphate isomerase/epimerase n=1 Tax=Pelagihabitans pacificus TaxID=2696054 RepID=A0A967AT60_9FLAO|nr:sugar phosphate isomerase/epimerase [Pelagihabitans pacificus]NHF59559.1 sugar phosphate isomerase/epimerase [Pelagihabitans pacificus]
MLQVGIFTGYFPYGLEETAKRIRDLGFNTVQLDLTFKDMDLSTENITKEKCIKIRDTFRRYNLPISCISSYTNLTDPIPGRRKANLDRLKKIIEHAHDLGSPYVPSETGTFHPDSDWIHHPKNKTEQGYEECRDIIKELVDFSRDHGVTFVVETYVNNVIGSIEESLRLFADIDDPHLKLAMDPTNYFEEHNIGDIDGTLNRIFDALSDKIVFAHAKDVKLVQEDKGVQLTEVTATEGHSLRGVGKIELPAPGLGDLNYNLYLRRLAKAHPNLPIIIEHLEEEDIPRAKKFLDQKLMEEGV